MSLAIECCLSPIEEEPPVCPMEMSSHSVRCDKLIQEARTERDQAFLMAHQYRDAA